MARFAYARSAFYRKLYAGRDLGDFRSLPTIDKSVFMGEFDSLNVEGLSRDELLAFAEGMERSREFLRYYRGRYVVGLSTGTSGARGLTVTPRETARRMPFVFLARIGFRLSLLPLKAAFLLRVDNKAFSNINSPLVKLRYFHTMSEPEAIVEGMNAMGANALMGPPSLLRIVARRAGTLRRRLGLLVSFAEVLYPDDEALLERAFGVRPTQIYQTTEGPIATPCRAGSLHVNEDLMHVELVGADGREILEPGRRSTGTIVTNLYNRVHPLVRYRMNDVLELGHRCPCGSHFRVIARVHGRSDDVLWVPRRAGGGLKPLFPDLASRWIVGASDDVTEYRVTQDEPAALRLELELREGADRRAVEEALRTRFSFELERYGLAGLDLRFSDAPPERGPGKFKRFQRRFPEPGEA
jgi:putative adenylate-forming enzyme